MMLLANQASVFFDERYLKKEYTDISRIFFLQIDINKETGNLSMFSVKIPKTCKNEQEIRRTKLLENRILWISIPENLVVLTLRMQ